MELLKRFWNEEEGQGLVEYALIIGLIAVVVIGAVTLLGDQISALFDNITGKLEEPSGVTDTSGN